MPTDCHQVNGAQREVVSLCFDECMIIYGCPACKLEMLVIDHHHVDGSPR